MERTTKVSVPIYSDEKGYMDRQYPAENCEFLFKVHEEDWEIALKMKPFGAHSVGMKLRPSVKADIPEC